MENSVHDKSKQQNGKVNGMIKASKDIKKNPKDNKKKKAKKGKNHKKDQKVEKNGPVTGESIFQKAQRIYEQVSILLYEIILLERKSRSRE
jgi:hypothetical protein